VYLLGHLGSVESLFCPSGQSAWSKETMAAYYDFDPDEGLGYYPLNGNYGINQYIYGGLTSGWWVRPEMMNYPTRTVYTFDYTFYTGGVALNAASNLGVFPGLFSRPTTAVMQATLAASANYSRMALNARHTGASINSVYHDGHGAARGVFDLHNPSAGGANGVANTGITVEGDRFWGRNPVENLARLRHQSQ